MATTTKARDQFIATLARHLGKEYDEIEHDARLLLRHGTTSGRYAEAYCNRELFWWEVEADEKNDRRIRQVAASLGCGVVFSGDPRGHTVKLILPDGYTDDFGQTGFCVPTS